MGQGKRGPLLATTGYGRGYGQMKRADPRVLALPFLGWESGGGVRWKCVSTGDSLGPRVRGAPSRIREGGAHSGHAPVSPSSH